MPALSDLIRSLSALEPADDAVVSLYLNLQPDERGRDSYDAFLRKEFKHRLKGLDPRSPWREGLARDFSKIERYLENELQPSSNGLAVFASDAPALFEAVQVDAPFPAHRLYIDRQPHLYPLARLDRQYPRYAALLTDSRSARLFVFSNGSVERQEEVQSEKSRRSSVGGWSQARYQRHTENLHLQHAKEVVDMLERVVRAESIEHVILSGEEQIVRTLRGQLAPDVAALVVDVAKLSPSSPEHEVLERTLELLRGRDAEDDRARVQRLLDAYLSSGLAVVGPEETRKALDMGQADEVLIAATLDEGAAAAHAHGSVQGGEAPPPEGTDEERKGEEFVTRAAQTSAKVTFIEDPALLADVGGVGALLRYRID